MNISAKIQLHAPYGFWGSNTLGWRLLEQRCADACLILFYKIVYGLVEIPLPSGQNDQNYALHALHTNTHYIKYIKLL